MPKTRKVGGKVAMQQEEITNLLPMGNVFIATYRSLPGMKWIGDRAYEQIRDNRYNWFGKRDSTITLPILLVVMSAKTPGVKSVIIVFSTANSTES